MIDKRSAALLIALILATGSLIVFDQTQKTQAEPHVVETTTTSSSTTTSTIDLSFLNTTTTTQFVQPKETDVTEFFNCIRWVESRNNYSAVSKSGTFMGAYQIYQDGWDTFASHIERHDLIGVPPHTASPADQDAVALAMYNSLGSKPWGGACK